MASVRLSGEGREEMRAKPGKVQELASRNSQSTATTQTTLQKKRSACVFMTSLEKNLAS